MDVTLTFSLRPHGPFRVSTGVAGQAVDATVDRAQPLPASSLKGLARHCASEVLELPAALIAEVFGSPAAPSPWAWSDLRVAPATLHVRTRAQVAIDDATGTAAARALTFAEEIWLDPHTPAPEFAITLSAPLSADALRLHTVVLLAAMCGVHSVGASRRRGLGWVTITPVAGVPLPGGLTHGPALMADVAREIVSLAGAS